MANSKEEAEREAEDARRSIIAADAGREVRDDLLPWLIQGGTGWVQSQRDAHRPGARPLDDREVDALERFFGPTIMNLASIKAVPHIENPPFYPMLAQSGIPVIDFAQAGGITFIDTILIPEQRTPPGPVPLSLVFHELVHVVQYDLVGVDEFVSRYVKGWFAQGAQYASVPIERQAYDLQARYEANPSIGFSVVAYVDRAGVPQPGNQLGRRPAPSAPGAAVALWHSRTAGSRPPLAPWRTVTPEARRRACC